MKSLRMVIGMPGRPAVDDRHEDHLIAAAGLRFHEPCSPMKALNAKAVRAFVPEKVRPSAATCGPSA